jgi:hypothetical protein
MKANVDPVACLYRDIKDVKRRMGRFVETGDIKRLMKLGVRLAQIQDMLELLQKKEAARLAPKFRKSYSFEAWCDALAMGRTQQTFL